MAGEEEGEARGMILVSRTSPFFCFVSEWLERSFVTSTCGPPPPPGVIASLLNV